MSIQILPRKRMYAGGGGSMVLYAWDPLSCIVTFPAAVDGEGWEPGARENSFLIKAWNIAIFFRKI